MSEDDSRVARPTALYPQPEITPSEFEKFVAHQLLGSADSKVNDLVVTLHEKIVGTDGVYDFDATVRYRFAGMSFLVLVEAKLHKNPIKRELVQVLHQKVQSVGAHKGVMVSTAPYQTGALQFAKVHGIALVTVTEGRFVFNTRDAAPTPHTSREEAGEGFGQPRFVAHHFGPGGKPGTTQAWLMSPDDDEYPCYVAELVLGQPSG
ncbi:restriction endonuclease [Streptomyces sp. NPDC002680]|uniref:restriction endonuclease n=1 Tax=Streptomyces sp. NPDC002680 TaxID=3364659 RepID=UPI00367A34C0